MMPLVFLLKTSDQSSECKIQITKTNQRDGKQMEDKHGRHCTLVCSSVSVVGSFLYKAADHRVPRRDPLQDLSAGKHGVIALPLTLFVTNLSSEEVMRHDSCPDFCRYSTQPPHLTLLANIFYFFREVFQKRCFFFS